MENLQKIELWFWKLLIFILILISGLNYLDNRQQDKLIFGIIDIGEQQIEIMKDISDIMENVSYIMKDKIDIWTVLNRMAEDYPPKK